MRARAELPRHSDLAPASGGYREYAATPALRPFVECFWTRDARPAADEQPVHRVLPDGCIDVVLGYRVGEDGSAASAVAVGTMTRALVLTGDPAESFVGARFRPAKAAAFLPLPASELTDLRVPLEEIWRDAAAVRETLAMDGDAATRVATLERVLAGRLERAGAVDHRDVDEAVRRIVAAGGSLGITRLAPALGVTRQHLARRFAQLVGVSPKTFARVVRLRRLVERVHALGDETEVSWSTLAAELGYYDQSHLIDEFRELTGVTPGAWRRPEGRVRREDARSPVPFFQDTSMRAR